LSTGVTEAVSDEFEDLRTWVLAQGPFDHDDRHYPAQHSPEEIAKIEAEAMEAMAERRARGEVVYE